MRTTNRRRWTTWRACRRSTLWKRPQSTQREITIESFAVLKVLRPGVELCNELLVQYPLNGDLGQVCPDNMAILTDAPLEPT